MEKEEQGAEWVGHPSNDLPLNSHRSTRHRDLSLGDSGGVFGQNELIVGNGPKSAPAISDRFIHRALDSVFPPPVRSIAVVIPGNKTVMFDFGIEGAEISLDAFVSVIGVDVDPVKVGIREL
jgi:hypothetical protein